MRKLVLAATAMMLFSLTAFADIARPNVPKPDAKTKKSVETTLIISLRDTNEAKLVIPRSQLDQLRAQLNELDGGGINSAAAIKTSPDRFTSLQTIVSGAFLSLAIAFGGIWFVRSKATLVTKGRALAIAACLFLSGVA